MSAPLQGGGFSDTALALSPAPPHHLSRQPSREDMELAEQLVSHARGLRDADSHVPEARAGENRGLTNRLSGEYHSLDDVQAPQMDDPTMNPSQEAVPSQQRLQSGSVPMGGQVCRRNYMQRLRSISQSAKPVATDKSKKKSSAINFNART
ncbi:GATA type transcriptional activator of nitrogen-regulated proteins [Cryomyces antarcticus]|uniref:GATA type transcriptional activator of nitrogen-regulated proteins n=1 Tax=Cryomyces antarcticus TaxID=329879 RepID=A0ABR0M5P7_9PEZI|nr:GATA type transcriptional activator of nitrogen-regulated proteins [Cryomyces antarcticus]